MASHNGTEGKIVSDEADYAKVQVLIDAAINKNRTKNRFESFSKRENKSGFSMEHIKLLSHGKYETLWRGMQIMKDPLDFVIYQQLLWHEKPRTIFEIGAYTGANAAWMADTMVMYQSPCHVYSLDINLNLLHPLAKENKNVTFLEGDAKKMTTVFPESMIKDLPHPWVISEDAHVDLYGCMEHFHSYMLPGDYFIIEDTNPDMPLVTGQGLIHDDYEPWGLQKMYVLQEFMTKYDHYYSVDCFYTDYFGYNGTLNWNGYIKRIA